MRFHENEEAVSPVIGVILMVAITVILAAVIAVFVFGMTDSVQTTHTVAATAKLSDDTVLVTYQGGPDASKVTSINASVYNVTGGGQIDTNVSGENPPVGWTATLSTGSYSNQDRVVITATFDDDTTQVILDKLI